MHSFRPQGIKGMSAAFLALACVLLFAMSCGSSGPESATPAGSKKAPSGEFELDVANCAGFSIEDAAAAVGVPAASLQDQSQDLGENSRWCIFKNTENAANGVMFTVSRADSTDDAVTEFQQFRDHASTAASTIGEMGQQVHEIEGLGDEAVWAPVPGGVYARKGRYSLQVNSPPDEEKQVQIARKILGS
jgi:hypothetical protein